MKNVKFLFAFGLMITTSFAFAHDRSDTIKVSGGKCASCKQQIEQIAKADGVSKAEWNSGTNQLIITYNTHKIKLDDIQKKLADAGYDTEKYKAADEVYNKLEVCCQYRRQEKNATKTTHSHS